MYEHMTRFIEDLDDGRFDESAFTHALYDPPVIDRWYRETLEAHGLDGMKPWGADVEHLDLPTTLALLTFVHRADHFSWGALQKAAAHIRVRILFIALSICFQVQRKVGAVPNRGTIRIGFPQETDPVAGTISAFLRIEDGYTKGRITLWLTVSDG